MAKVFLVKLSKAMIVTLEQLVAMFFLLTEFQFELLAELCTVFQTRVLTKTKQLIRKIS